MTFNVTLSDGTTTVEIQTSSVEHSLDKAGGLIEINIARTKSSYSKGVKTKIVDLLKVKETFNIRGRLIATAAKTDDQIFDDLITIINAGGGLTLTYRGYSYNVNVRRKTVTEETVDEIYAKTSNAESSGSGVVVEVDKTEGFAVGDKVSVHGMSGGNRVSEGTTVDAISAGTSMTMDLTNSYDASAKVTKLVDGASKYGVQLLLVVGDEK